MVSWFAKYERLLLPVSETGSRVDVVITLTPALPSAQVQPEPRGAQRNASAP